MIERQELYCHGCEQYVQFDVDTSLNGNHVLNCPRCGHRHYRLVENGRITGIRWSPAQPRYMVSASTITTMGTSAWDTYHSTASGANQYLLMQSWMNTTTRT